MSVKALCQSCGLCCDGTLFDRVPLGLGERVPDERLGVLSNATGGRFVPQRCAALLGTVCQVYAQRPEACRRYTCLLFNALKEGEVDLVDAMEVVERVKRLAGKAKDEAIAFHFGRRP